MALTPVGYAAQSNELRPRNIYDELEAAISELHVSIDAFQTRLDSSLRPMVEPPPKPTKPAAPMSANHNRLTEQLLRLEVASFRIRQLTDSFDL